MAPEDRHQYRMSVEYDGTDFFGYQTQRNQNNRTVQDELEKGLYKLFNKKIIIRGSSRTDKGVHAKAHGVCFTIEKDLNEKEFVEMINTRLPNDIVVHEIKKVSCDFDIRKNSEWKTYVYRIRHGSIRSTLDRRYEWFMKHQLSIDKMRQAIPCLIGQVYDFTSFTCSKPKFLKDDRFCFIKSIKIIEEDDIIFFHITGNRFLYRMVRVLVGTFVEIGLNKPKDMKMILNSKDRSLAGQGAPAHGLTLMEIEYS